MTALKRLKRHQPTQDRHPLTASCKALRPVARCCRFTSAAYSRKRLLGNRKERGRPPERHELGVALGRSLVQQRLLFIIQENLQTTQEVRVRADPVKRLRVRLQMSVMSRPCIAVPYPRK